jgi:hypothetical protein
LSLSKKERTLTRTIAGKANGMENEFLAVVIQANGTLGVTDKGTGRSWTDLGYFRDCSEIGNPWAHVGVPFDEVLNTLGEKARIARVLAGDLVTTYRVELDWELPASRSADEQRRSAERVSYRIVNMVTLPLGSRGWRSKPRSRTLQKTTTSRSLSRPGSTPQPPSPRHRSTW